MQSRHQDLGNRPDHERVAPGGLLQRRRSREHHPVGALLSATCGTANEEAGWEADDAPIKAGEKTGQEHGASFTPSRTAFCTEEPTHGLGTLDLALGGRVTPASDKPRLAS